MNSFIRVLFLTAFFAAVFSPNGYSRARMDEPAGAGGHSDASARPAPAATQPSTVRASDNGLCPTGYQCLQCGKV